VVVVEVMPGSPAARGGLRPCDLIEQVGGTAVDNPSEVQVAVDQGRVGQPLPLRVQRGPRQLNLQLRPAELPRQN
jgi:S1-C subfamily serine protease